MVQIDGSPHDWFEGRAGLEGRGERCCLMVAIDDATSRCMARFHATETTEASFDLLGRWIARYGLPRAIYVDQATIYRVDREPTAKELLAGVTPETQVGRALRELGIELILARSPQAKGRVERANRTLQDRLVKEMRLALNGKGIASVPAGNVFLETFLEDHNRRYAVTPAEAADEHRSVSSLGPGLCLEEILCPREQRIVAQDWCVRWHNHFLQIKPEHQRLQLPGKRVTVICRADQNITLRHDGAKLEYLTLADRPQTQRKRPKKQIVNNKEWKPPASHPWQRPFKTPTP
jgi:hypothetical protein